MVCQALVTIKHGDCGLLLASLLCLRYILETDTSPLFVIWAISPAHRELLRSNHMHM